MLARSIRLLDLHSGQIELDVHVVLALLVIEITKHDYAGCQDCDNEM